MKSGPAQSDQAAQSDHLAGWRQPFAATPGWFNAVLLVAASVVSAVGAVALVLAYLGQYHLVLGLLIGLPLAGVVVVAAWPVVTDQVPDPRCAFTAPAVAICSVALASVILNVSFESNHVQVNRDPGAYAVTAKWIATQGTLQVPSETLWQASGVSVVVASLGTYQHGDDGVQLQFAHFMPALFAVADGIGGDRTMFAMPAILGGLGLLAVYAVGCCLCRRRWLVCAAVSALAVSLPQLNVSRDTFSETGTQLLLWTSLWLMVLWLKRPRVGTAAVAGLMVGATLLTRIDALVYLIPVPILLVLSRRGRLGARQQVTAFVAPVVGLLASAVVDITQRSVGYYAMLRSQVLQLWLGLAVALVAAALLWAYLHRHPHGELPEWLSRLVPPVAAVILLAGWLVRPHFDHPKLATPNDVVSGLQAHEGAHVDALSSYGERTLVWMSWYVGPVTLLLAILGVAALLRVALSVSAEGDRSVQRDSAVAVLGVLGLASALYLWQPSIVPDQIWASRRFVPATLPFVVVAAAAGVEQIADYLNMRLKRVAVRGAVAILAVGMIAVPAYASAKVVRFVDQDGYLAAVDSTCRALGPDAAVVFNPGGRLELTWPQTIRSWCGAPAASLQPGAQPAQVQQLAAAWRLRGRTLWVLSDTAADVSRVLREPSPRELGAATSRRELIQTITHLPNGYTSDTVKVFGAPA